MLCVPGVKMLAEASVATPVAETGTAVPIGAPLSRNWTLAVYAGDAGAGLTTALNVVE